jgi:hypothetical protein
MKRIILSLILLVLMAGTVSAYTYGDDINTVELPRVDKTMVIDFSTSLTSRWMRPVDQALFTENGKEYVIQPLEITTSSAQLYVSSEKKVVIMAPGEEAAFQFGDALITVAFLEGQTYKGNFDFAREEKPVVVQTPEVVEKPVAPEVLPPSTPEKQSTFPW